MLPLFVYVLYSFVLGHLLPLGVAFGGALGVCVLFKYGTLRAYLRSAGLRDDNGNAIGWLAKLGDHSFGVFPVYYKLKLIYRLWRTREVALQVLRPDGTFGPPPESLGDQVRGVWASATKIGFVQDLLRLSGQLAALLVSVWVGYRLYYRTRRSSEARPSAKSPYFHAFEKAWGILALIGVAGFSIEFLADTHLASNVHHVIKSLFSIFGCTSESEKLNNDLTSLKCEKLRRELGDAAGKSDEKSRIDFDADLEWLGRTEAAYYTALTSRENRNTSATTARFDALASGKLRTQAGRDYWKARQAEIDERVAEEKALIKPPSNLAIPTVADLDDKVVSELKALREKSTFDMNELAPLVVKSVESEDDPVDMITSLAGPFARLKHYLVNNCSKVLATLALKTASAALIVSIGIALGFFLAHITNRTGSVTTEARVDVAFTKDVVKTKDDLGNQLTTDTKTVHTHVTFDPADDAVKKAAEKESEAKAKEVPPAQMERPFDTPKAEPTVAEPEKPKGKEPVIMTPDAKPLPASSLKRECIHVATCPKKVPCDPNNACNKLCGGHHCTHFRECFVPEAQVCLYEARGDPYVAVVNFSAKEVEPEGRKNRIKFFYDNFIKGLEEPAEDIEPLDDDPLDDFDPENEPSLHRGRRQTKREKNAAIAQQFGNQPQRRSNAEDDPSHWYNQTDESKSVEGANAAVDAKKTSEHVDAEKVRAYVQAIRAYRTALECDEKLAEHEERAPLRCPPLPTSNKQADTIITLIKGRLSYDPRKKKALKQKEARVNPEHAEGWGTKYQSLLQVCVHKDLGSYEEVYRKLLNPSELTYIGNAVALTTPNGPITATAAHVVDPVELQKKGWVKNGKTYDYVILVKMDDPREAFKAPTVYKLTQFHVPMEADFAYVAGSSVKALKYTDVISVNDALKSQSGTIVRVRNFKPCAANYNRLAARSGSKFEFDYNANTLGGDSGAPVFDKSGKLFGLHLANDGGVDQNVVLYLGDILRKLDVKNPSVPLNL